MMAPYHVPHTARRVPGTAGVVQDSRRQDIEYFAHYSSHNDPSYRDLRHWFEAHIDGLWDATNMALVVANHAGFAPLVLDTFEKVKAQVREWP